MKKIKKQLISLKSWFVTKTMNQTNLSVFRISVLMAAGFMITFPHTAYAIADTKIVTGTEKLIQDLISAAIALAALITTGVITAELIKAQLAEQEEKPKHKKNAKNTLLLGVGIIVVGIGVKAIFAYYQ